MYKPLYHAWLLRYTDDTHIYMRDSKQWLATQKVTFKVHIFTYLFIFFFKKWYNSAVCCLSKRWRPGHGNTHTNIISFPPFWDSARDNNLTSVVRGCCSCLPVPQRATYWFFFNTRINSSTVVSYQNVKERHPSSALQCKIQMEPGCSLFFYHMKS